MRVKLWGVRGSLPTASAPVVVETQVRALLTEILNSSLEPGTALDRFFAAQPATKIGGYGGNTSCVEIKTDRASIIIDSGSGIRALGQELMRGPLGAGRGEVHIFFTHFHWDHIIGLPFFAPVFRPGNEIHLYAVQPDLEKIIRTLFQKPFFPVPFEVVPSNIEFHRLEPRVPIMIGDLSLTPYQLDHPDPCWGFRITNGKRVFSYCVDTECVRTSAEDLGADLPLYQGIDAMVFDAQYTLAQAAERVNWGHSAAPIGLDIAMREGIKRMYFAHHDPFSSDVQIAAAEAATRAYHENQIKANQKAGRSYHDVHWEFAQEGLVIRLD